MQIKCKMGPLLLLAVVAFSLEELCMRLAVYAHFLLYDSFVADLILLISVNTPVNRLPKMNRLINGCGPLLNNLMVKCAVVSSNQASV